MIDFLSTGSTCTRYAPDSGQQVFLNLDKVSAVQSPRPAGRRQCECLRGLAGLVVDGPTVPVSST